MGAPARILANLPGYMKLLSSGSPRVRPTQLEHARLPLRCIVSRHPTVGQRVVSYTGPGDLPTQAETIVKGFESEGEGTQLLVKERSKDVDYLAVCTSVPLRQHCGGYHIRQLKTFFVPWR